MKHIDRVHLWEGDPIPIEWLDGHNKIICPICVRTCTAPKKPGDPRGHEKCRRMRLNVANEKPRNMADWDSVTIHEIAALDPHRHRNIPAPCSVSYGAAELRLNEKIANGTDAEKMAANKKLLALPKMVLLRQSRGGRR